MAAERDDILERYNWLFNELTEYKGKYYDLVSKLNASEIELNRLRHNDDIRGKTDNERELAYLRWMYNKLTDKTRLYKMSRYQKQYESDFDVLILPKYRIDHLGHEDLSPALDRLENEGGKVPTVLDH